MDYKRFPFYQRTNLEMLFNNAYEVYRTHFGWLFFFSFLFLVIIQPLTGYLVSDKMSDMDQLMQNPETLLSFYKGMSIYLLIFLITYTFIYLFLTHYIIARYLDPGMSTGAIAKQTLTKYYLRSLFVAIISYLIIIFGTLIGLLALIVGAFVAVIFLGVSLFPILPILVVEDTGVFETIRRSFRLVLKDFWTVLGYLIIFFLIVMLMSMIFGAISMAPYASSFIRNILNPGAQDIQGTVNAFQLMNKPLYIILNSLFSALLLPLTPIFSTLIYFHLSHVEDEKNKMPEETELI